MLGLCFIPVDHLRRVARGAILLAALAGAGAWPSPASAEYRLQASDTLELFVAGIPQLSRQSAINLDGNVILPLVGEIKAAGRTLAEVQTEFTERAAGIPILIDSTSGTRSAYVEPQQVTITIYEYRPIYVQGDVLNPGEQPFRPGITVRQAVAVAGGYDVMRFRQGNPFVESAELRGQYDELWIDYADAQARVAALEAELSGDVNLDATLLADVPVPRKVLEQVIENEQKQLSLRLDDLKKEKVYRAAAVDLAQHVASIVEEQHGKTKEDVDVDREDYERIRSLFDRGIAPLTRMSEVRQALLSSSIRYLDTTAELGTSSLNVEEAKRELEKVDSERRLELLQELGDAKIEREKARSKLSVVAEKLLYVGTGRTTLIRGLAGAPKIRVFNRENPQGVVAEEGRELLPGDLVEVTLEPITVNDQAMAGAMAD